ncbi:MAG TPA: substrate-binding domain-containing protein [Kribbella sp.]|nr:substrate-binding domain-containing protein [Kribbella sp.]
MFVVRSFGSESGSNGFLGGPSCDDPVPVSLSTTPELQSQLESAAKSLAGKNDNGSPCVQFTISAAPSETVAKGVASNGDNRPDLWIPDSSLWVARADDGQSVPTVAVPSIASSPLVLVGQNTVFANTNSWLGAFQNTEPAVLDPLNTSTGAAALLAVQGERAKTSASDTQVATIMVPLAQRLGSLAKAYTDVNGLFSKAAADGSNVVVPASEQAFVHYQEEHPDSLLKAVVPRTGTLIFDYPVVVTAKSNIEAVTEAAKQLAAEMLIDSSSQALDQAGFRNPLLNPLSGGRGVGDIDQLTKPTPQVVEKTLQQWATLSLSAHSLAVIDVSGSMGQKIGPKTRMQLTIEAAGGGLKLFPDNAALGLWIFSTKLSGNADWKPLVPIRKLTPQQRRLIVNQLSGQQARVGGGTGLYDTAIAAVRTVRDSYDPSAVNAVLLFTDGKNDDPGSLTLDQAVRALESLRDPARPVRIIALGMGPDADSAELARLAEATGGRSYLARNPADLQRVFIDALQNR